VCVCFCASIKKGETNWKRSSPKNGKDEKVHEVRDEKRPPRNYPKNLEPQNVKTMGTTKKAKGDLERRKKSGSSCE